MTSAAKIVLIEDYLKAEEKPDTCWALDIADGYAYWHTRLPKGKATGLILGSITNTGVVDESYYYGINAKENADYEAEKGVTPTPTCDINHIFILINHL